MPEQILRQIEETKRISVTRAEWFGALALALSVLEGAYLGGIEAERVNDHDRRITGIEVGQAARSTKIDGLIETTTRMDTELNELIELEKERRQRFAK